MVDTDMGGNQTMMQPLEAAQRAGIRQRAVPVLPEPLHENAVLHRVLAARGMTSQRDLGFSLADIPKPDTLPDIAVAVERLLAARSNNERVLIVGDYDCDGATSTVVALLGLKMLGFTQVNYVIPSRFEFGYGLSPAIVDIAREQHQAQLILTVDNGVASVDGVTRATDLGIDVVVTDHHLAPEVLPEAIAIVNPNVPGAVFDGRNLAGVGVIFYTLLAVRARLKALGDSCADAALVQLLDLVAIGTVADVVPLDALNRTLVEQGLRRIRHGHSRPGVVALLEVAGRKWQTMTTQDIGFGIGPRLNAAGRLDDMRIGVQCLLSDSAENAVRFAQQLNKLNQSRQGIERDMQKSASEQLEKLADNSIASNDSFAICLKDDDWHQGVVGILAGRIKESTYKPVVIFTSDDDEHLKGSARSIPGVHIRDVLQNIVARHPGMISKFGGHAMAAGLTLRRSHFEPFQEAFNEAVKFVLDGQASVREYLTDGALVDTELTLDNALLLAGVMPWGQGFEAPLFNDTFRLVSQRVVGERHLKLLLETQQFRQRIDAIAFNQQALAPDVELLQVVYSLDANFFRDAYTLQLRVQYLEPCTLR